jgi:hypothetical protein
LTLQDRLVKELRLREISDVKAATAFAPEFIADYNRRFARDLEANTALTAPCSRPTTWRASSAGRKAAWSRRA